MITYIEASLFTSTAQTLVNTVNTVGVMGKGLAKAFKTFYPEMFADYKRRCDVGELTAGRLLLYRSPHKWIVNFPTKRHWRQPSRLEDIEAGLQTFAKTYAEQGMVSVAFPQLGCGNGGLDWEHQVRPLMERCLGPLPIDVQVHIASEPDAGDAIDQDDLAIWLHGEPPSLPFAAFWHDLLASASIGDAAGWRLDGSNSTLSWSCDDELTALGADDLFDLWHQLRSVGYLAPDDASILSAIPAAPLFSLLTSLPYIAPVHVAHGSSIMAYDGRSTCAVLDAPEAQGVHLLPPLFLKQHAEQAPLTSEGGALWSGNRTTSQLALFSTS